ncbi:5868_t:CDS:2 [Funneliformis mosseae]|uniref:5868_t:CDS:1 n=1 Tax=Funneliformis mosseae TaxID=27381 RepID=A0A9N9DJV4_FUNMO|nr:5868_t:CDS:2 [Funneliformis mosseae]
MSKNSLSLKVVSEKRQGNMGRVDQSHIRVFARPQNLDECKRLVKTLRSQKHVFMVSGNLIQSMMPE